MCVYKYNNQIVLLDTLQSFPRDSWWCLSKTAFPFFLKHPLSMTLLVPSHLLGFSFSVYLWASFTTQTVRNWNPLGPVLSPSLFSCPMLFSSHFFHFCCSIYHLSASLLWAALSSRPVCLTAHWLPHLDISQATSNSTCPKQKSLFSELCPPKTVSMLMSSMFY